MFPRGAVCVCVFVGLCVCVSVCVEVSMAQCQFDSPSLRLCVFGLPCLCGSVLSRLGVSLVCVCLRFCPFVFFGFSAPRLSSLVFWRLCVSGFRYLVGFVSLCLCFRGSVFQY